jgi:hypothetical protein
MEGLGEEGEQQRQVLRGPSTTLGFVEVHKNRDDKVPSCNLYYELHGNPDATQKILFITGRALSDFAWI